VLPTIGLGVLALDEAAVEVIVAVTVSAVGAVVLTSVGGSVAGSVVGSVGGSTGGTGGGGGSGTGNPMMLIFLVQGVFRNIHVYLSHFNFVPFYLSFLQGFL